MEYEDYYTDKQKKYVENIPDNQLRDHLLHQVSMRDQFEAEKKLLEYDNEKLHEVIRMLNKRLEIQTN